MEVKGEVAGLLQSEAMRFTLAELENVDEQTVEEAWL